MNQETETALSHYLLALADDQLILAHRNSEWIGHAPILEEDIALANIAQDELGHASLLYTIYGELVDADPDELVFFREANAFRSVQMVEYPKGDWAFTMLRQYLFDAAEMTLLTHLRQSNYEPLAQVAAKMRNEEIYHHRHTSTWLKRLGQGTEESHRRTQDALTTLWSPAQQLFLPLPDALLLEEAGIIPPAAAWKREWLETVRPFLVDCNLFLPVRDTPPSFSRREHSAYLSGLLAEMQTVARLDPEAEW